MRKCTFGTTSTRFWHFEHNAKSLNVFERLLSLAPINCLSYEISFYAKSRNLLWPNLWMIWSIHSSRHDFVWKKSQRVKSAKSCRNAAGKTDSSSPTQTTHSFNVSTMSVNSMQMHRLASSATLATQNGGTPSHGGNQLTVGSTGEFQKVHVRSDPIGAMTI